MKKLDLDLVILDEAQRIKPILIRRTKKEVLKQLSERLDKNYFVPVTDEQVRIHEEYYEMVCKLVNKWRKHKFLSEQDRQSLIIGLNCMRTVLPRLKDLL